MIQSCDVVWLTERFIRAACSCLTESLLFRSRTWKWRWIGTWSCSSGSSSYAQLLVSVMVVSSWLDGSRVHALVCCLVVWLLHSVPYLWLCDQVFLGFLRQDLSICSLLDSTSHEKCLKLFYLSIYLVCAWEYVCVSACDCTHIPIRGQFVAGIRNWIQVIRLDCKWLYTDPHDE